MGIKLSEHFGYTKLLKFTFPTIIMMIFNSLYGIVDGIFVSNFAGSDAFAAVNIVWPLIMVFSALGYMIGTGGSALVSKKLGEKEKETANRYFSMLLYFDIVMGIIISIGGYFIIRPIAELIGAEGDILEYGVTYGKILLIPLTPYILQKTFQSFLVAAERPKLGLIITVIAGITNMIFDFILIYVLKMGIVGAAIATGLSQCVGGLVPLVFFMCDNGTQFRLIKTSFEMKPIGKACLNGLSEMMMMMSLSIVNTLYNYQLMRITGSSGIVAYGIIQYVCYTFECFFTGYSNGSAPIISFHFGAKNTDELKNLFKRGIVIVFLSSILLFSSAEILAPFLTRIFVGYDEELYNMSVPAVRIYSILFLITGYNIFASSLFTGLNNGIVSAVISLSRTLIFETTMIFVLPLIFGIYGIWMAVSVAEGITLLVTFTLLILNRKKYRYF
ncbi:Na+-driven multidrug efflux pump [Anaeromyces robustus]|uniref:Multidrug export protein MepA n=1 Tax=Anaeromyces robustus TaxID=1754192 RepID=A0A1Y1VRC8_9FUNG|nr:Na+-driven multidrug efflux pump [Anaeromyces robustus]|eukprot:ORX63820.1 Na+-driven multidrug efflux pump [Anaeromyces robustus]